MRQCTKYVSTVCFLLRQSLRTLATGAGSLALLLALLALVTSKQASGFGLTSNREAPFFDPAQATIPLPVLFPAQLAVTPALPVANSAITIRASGDWHDSCIPRYQTHQITGNLITIVAVVNPPTTVCGQVITPWSFSVPIGILPVGSYQVDLTMIRYGSAARYATSTFLVAPAPVAKLIPEVGGEVTQHDRGQRTTLIIPPGALRAPTVFAISYQPAPTVTAPLQFVGHPIAVMATQTSFTMPFTLTMRYSDTVRGPVIPGTTALYRWQADQWVTEGITVTTNLTDGLTAQITHLTLYALLGETTHFYLPIAR